MSDKALGLVQLIYEILLDMNITLISLARHTLPKEEFDLFFEHNRTTRGYIQTITDVLNIKERKQ